MQIDGDQELLEGQNGKADSGNLFALTVKITFGTVNELVHKERVVVQEIWLVSSVVRDLEVSLTANESGKQSERA